LWVGTSVRLNLPALSSFNRRIIEAYPLKSSENQTK